MRTKLLATLAGVTTVTALIAAPTVATATASSEGAPQGYDEQDHEAVRFYGSFEKDILLFTGLEPEALCHGEPEPTVSARVFTRQDGSVDLKVNAREMPILLYHSPLGAPEFIDETCGLLFDGDPLTEPAEPFATGTANFKERIRVAPDGGEAHSNGVNGFATDTDGTTWKIRTWADFSIVDGMLIGDPAEFQGLTIHQVGP